MLSDSLSFPFVFFVLTFASNILPALWVSYDASKNQIPTDSKPYGKINGALAWLLGCLLFPMVGLIYFLVKRTLVLDEKRRATTMPIG